MLSFQNSPRWFILHTKNIGTNPRCHKTPSWWEIQISVLEISGLGDEVNKNDYWTTWFSARSHPGLPVRHITGPLPRKMSTSLPSNPNPGSLYKGVHWIPASPGLVATVCYQDVAPQLSELICAGIAVLQPSSQVILPWTLCQPWCLCKQSESPLREPRWLKIILSWQKASFLAASAFWQGSCRIPWALVLAGGRKQNCDVLI